MFDAANLVECARVWKDTRTGKRKPTPEGAGKSFLLCRILLGASALRLGLGGLFEEGLGIVLCCDLLCDGLDLGLALSLDACYLEREALEAIIGDVGTCAGFEDEHVLHCRECGLAELAAFILTGDVNEPYIVGVLGGLVNCYDSIHNCGILGIELMFMMCVCYAYPTR